jgi:glutamate-5-semialdehyde dehydrogenase
VANVVDTGIASDALMLRLGRAAVTAAGVLARAESARKDRALRAAALALRARSHQLLAANGEDLAAARGRGLGPALLDRLTVDPRGIEAMAAGLEAIAALPDPVGTVAAHWTRPNGLAIERRRVPLGVIGIVYESRPNVTADAGALCVKSGNAVILRGGSESVQSSRAIHSCLIAGLESAGLPVESVQLVPTTDRDAVRALLSGLEGTVNLIVPRGGKDLVREVARHARVPVIGHLEGNCHVYVHAAAELGMARAIVLNSKMRRRDAAGGFGGGRHAPRPAGAGLAGRGLRSPRRPRDSGRRPARSSGERAGLAHGISRRDHRRARGRRHRGRHRPHRDLRLLAHGVNRDGGHRRRRALPVRS